MKVSKRQFIFPVLLIVAFSISICLFMYYYTSTSGEKYNILIQPPCVKADLPMETYYINNDSICDINRPTGTRIRISAHTFRRKDGAAIQAPVEFRVREFHHVGDILRSGIPMAIGTESDDYLESAGMIEMRAYENGDELDIQQGKKIEVALAAFKPSEGYQLYYLQNNSNWKVEGLFTNEENQNKKNLKDEIQMLVTKLQQSDTSEPSTLIFDVTGYDEVSPYLSSLKCRSWKLEKLLVKTDTDLLFRKNWDSISLSVVNKQKNIYRMTLHSGGIFMDEDEPLQPETVSLIVSPVFSKYNKKADGKKFESELEAYHVILEKMKEEEKRLSLQADMLNSFSAGNLGVYNVDRILKCPDYQSLPVSFDFSDQIDPRVNKIMLYAIYEGINSVISYPPGKWDKVVINPNKKMKLVAVLPGEQVAEADEVSIRNAMSGNRQTLLLRTKRYNAMIYFSEKGNSLAFR